MQRVTSGWSGTGVVRFHEEIDGADVDIVLTLEIVPMHPGLGNTMFVLKGLETVLTAEDLKEGISSRLIRKIPVAKFTERAAIMLIEDFTESPGGSVLSELADVAKAQGPTDETLRLIGHLYSDTIAIGGNPVQRIVDLIGISRATATRWVRKSRDKGYILALESEIRSGDIHVPEA